METTPCLSIIAILFLLILEANMKSLQTLVAIVAITTTVVALGCDDGPRKANVSGIVQLDGKPLPKAVIIFENVTTGHGASTPIYEGRYAFKSRLPLGSYRIAIQYLEEESPLEPSNREALGFKIPTPYLTAATSSLSTKIDKNIDDLSFDLVTRNGPAIAP